MAIEESNWLRIFPEALRCWKLLKAFTFQIFDLPESLYSNSQHQTSREHELSHLETSFTGLNTLEQEEAGHEEEEESEEEEEDVRNSFDIETLVDECFMNETSRRGVIVQSWGKLWRRKIQTETSSVADSSNQCKTIHRRRIVPILILSALKLFIFYFVYKVSTVQNIYQFNETWLSSCLY